MVYIYIFWNISFDFFKRPISLGFNFNYLSYTFALCDFWLVSSKIFCGMKMERKKGRKDGRKRGENTRGLVLLLKNTYISVPVSQFILPALTPLLYIK